LTNLRGGRDSTPEENLSADDEKLWTSAGLAPRSSLELLPFWNLLAAAREDKRAKERCKRLKQDWELKDSVLGRLQRGVLINWLKDHPHVVDEIVLHYGPPITREWLQYIAPVIEDDQAADAKAQATPERVEFHLYDLPRRSVVKFCSPNGYRVMILFPPNVAARLPVSVFPSDRVEIYLPDTVQQWRPEDVEAMRDWPVVVFPANTEASWEQAMAIAEKIRDVAASVRIIGMLDLKRHLQNDLAACELWGFWLCRCQFGAHWTVGDEHFRNDCKLHREVRRLEELRTYNKARAGAD
jgi:hypothetical protein